MIFLVLTNARARGGGGGGQAKRDNARINFLGDMLAFTDGP